MAESRGMQVVRSNDNSILFRAVLFDVADAKITAGTASLRLWHVVPATGVFESFKWDTDTWIAAGVENTVPTVAMVYQSVTETGPVTYHTGIWDYRQTVLTNFTVGDKYIAEVSHASLARPITFEFQYGDVEGDVGRNLLCRGPELAAAFAASTITLAAAAPATLNYYSGCLVKIIDGTGEGQVRVIHHYTAARVCHVDPWTTALDATSRYVILPKSDESFIVNSGMATAGGASTISLALTAEGTVDNIYRGMTVVITGGTGVGQARVITTYDATGGASERLATVVRAWTTAPDATSTYAIFPFAADDLVDLNWDEDVVAAHGGASTAGLLVRVLGAEISTRANNNTLNDLLGVPDTAGTDTVCGQVWQELLAGHNTLNTMGWVMNSIVTAGFPTVAAIAAGVWDELSAGHLIVGSKGLELAVLGADIAARANFPSLNSLLGVPDSAGHNIADTVFNTDMTHWTVADTDQAGWLLRVLGLTMSRRTNTPDMNDLLGVPDVAGRSIAFTVWNEVISSAVYNVANSAGRRLWTLDDLTEVGGAGDLAYVLAQVTKVDQGACDSPAVADSLADKLDDLTTLVGAIDLNILTSCNIQGNNLRIEVAVEQYGLIQLVPWDQCVAQIFDESGAIVANIGAADFGAITVRGFFQYTLTPHPLTSGHTYQAQVTVTNTGLGTTLQTTKVCKVTSV